MELLILFAIVVIAFQLGKHYGYYRIVKLMKEVADEQGIDLEKELGIVKQQEEKKSSPSVHTLQVEQHGEMLYLFDVESDNFICQGSNVQELAKIALDTKKIEYAAVKHGEIVYKFVKGTSTEVTA